MPAANKDLCGAKWLGLLKKKDYASEPYENPSKRARELLLEFHTKHANAPRDYRLEAA